MLFGSCKRLGFPRYLEFLRAEEKPRLSQIWQCVGWRKGITPFSSCPKAVLRQFIEEVKKSVKNVPFTVKLSSLINYERIPEEEERQEGLDCVTQFIELKLSICN